MVIRLHERLSEYSYGYGVTREVQLLLETVGLKPTPFMPNLLHEEELGFDAGFKDLGHVVVLQFKLGEQLKRFHRTDPFQTIPDLTRPFYRFTLDTAGHQFQHLVGYEVAGADTYYVAPRFATWTKYDRYFQSGNILDHSLLVKPSEIQSTLIAQGSGAGRHRIAYDVARRYVCSEPIEIGEYRPNDLLDRAMASQSAELTLKERVIELFERPRNDVTSSRHVMAKRDALFERFKDPVKAMAVAIGAEAWSQGAQMIFVTTEQSASEPWGA